MKVTRLRFQKWKIVTHSTIAIAIMFALILLIHGIDEQGMRVEIRATARTSCILFVGTFIASALHRILSNRITTWLVKNRPYLGISFAISHVFHALAIIGLIVVIACSSYGSSSNCSGDPKKTQVRLKAIANSINSAETFPLLQSLRLSLYLCCWGGRDLFILLLKNFF